MLLSDIQLKQFNQDGYLILRGFVSAKECDAILEVAKKHLAEKIPPLETESEYIGDDKEEFHVTVRRLRQVYGRDVVFKKWMENVKIRPILKQILGENPVITTAHHNSIMTKMPHVSTETSWHQDFRYWNFETDNLVSVWLALDEEREENGVLEFIPGSHKMVFTPEQFEDKQYFSVFHSKNKALIKSKTSTVLHKGDVVLFHCKLLHRANKNNSDKAKISFVYTVKGESNKTIAGTRSAEFPEIVL